MEERRKPAHEVTPQNEDAGLFKTRIVQVTVELVPRVGHNMRKDIMIKGFIDGNSAIDVVFPGRRTRLARPLVARLQNMLSDARNAARAVGQTADLEDVRHPVQIEGTWRPRFYRDDQGWETRRHQLYASRWVLKDQTGHNVIYGEIPRHY